MKAVERTRAKLRTWTSDCRAFDRLDDKEESIVATGWRRVREVSKERGCLKQNRDYIVKMMAGRRVRTKS